MPYALLLAMQAAGMVTDLFGISQQQDLNAKALKIKQNEIETQIFQSRLETEDASLQAMKDLRKNLGTQMAVLAARGTNPGAGSALALTQESLGNFNSDERMRRMNQMGREATLRAGGSIAKLNQQSQNNQMWQSFASRSLNTIGNPSNWGRIAKGASQGFGLTSLGS